MPWLVAAVMLVAVLVVIYSLKNLLYVAQPNEVLVLSGSLRRAGNRVIGYRAVRGGRAVRLPLLEQVDQLSLVTMSISFDSFEVLTRGGLPVRVDLLAHVRPAGDEPLLGQALECLLGYRREEIAAIARRVLTGILIGVAAKTRPDALVRDAESFKNAMIEEAEHALAPLGLELDALKLTSVSDEHGYLDALGRQA